MSDHEGAIADLQYAQSSLTDTDFIDEEIHAMEHELEITSEMILVSINVNAANTKSEEEYRAKHSELCKRFKDTEEKLNGLKQEMEQMRKDVIAIGGMLFELSLMVIIIKIII